MEGNCHFLEFPALKMLMLTLARKVSVQPNSGSQHCAAELPAQCLLSGTSLAFAAEGAKESSVLDAGSARKSARIAKSVGAGCQGFAKQVLLYCFRFGNCGTFMPLSRARGESRIAVAWTRFAAAFSAISSVHFRILCAQEFFFGRSLHVVQGRARFGGGVRGS